VASVLVTSWDVIWRKPNSRQPRSTLESPFGPGRRRRGTWNDRRIRVMSHFEHWFTVPLHRLMSISAPLGLRDFVRFTPCIRRAPLNGSRRIRNSSAPCTRRSSTSPTGSGAGEFESPTLASMKVVRVREVRDWVGISGSGSPDRMAIERTVLPGRDGDPELTPGALRYPAGSLSRIAPVRERSILVLTRHDCGSADCHGTQHRRSAGARSVESRAPGRT
jgi:hypothetical protein